MGCRLTILVCVRETGERLERWGVSHRWLCEWFEKCSTAVSRPCQTVEQVRLLEIALSDLFAEAFNEVERVAHEAAK